jgi:hypothetical protein
MIPSKHELCIPRTLSLRVFEFPRRTLLETVWKITGGLVERGFWLYKRAK